MSDKNSEEITIFVDTNAFIHLKDLKDLPWKTIFPKLRCLNIMVSSRVIEELDKFKVGASDRKRNRSRKALKQIKEAATSLDSRLKIRNKHPQIWLSAPLLPATDWSKYPCLDPSKPDDHLVIDTLIYGKGAIVFSHDTGPYIRAMQMGLRAEEPGEKNWALPSEPSKEELKIRELQRDLKKAKETYPNIIAKFGTKSIPVEQFDFIIPVLPPLDQSVAERMAKAYLKFNSPHSIPVRDNPFDLMLGSPFNQDYTEDDRVSYERDYSKFQAEVWKFFEDLHVRVSEISSVQPIPYFVENTSPVTAKGLRLDCNVSDTVYLAANGDDVATSVGKISFPDPPKKPQKGMFPNMSMHNALIRSNKPRDPTGFYWESRPEMEDQASALQCQEFRPTEIRPSEAWLCARAGIPLPGSIKIKVSASNMREPVSIVAPFTFSEVKTTWQDDRVHTRLPELLSKAIRDQC